MISRCDLRNAAIGVYLGDDTHGCQLRGCDITQTQGDGVSIQGTSTNHERVTDHVIDNNYIWDFGWGRIHNRCGGVYMYRCAHCKLTHNHVHDSPRYGLAMDVGNDCEFAYNDCHDVNLVTTDSGIIEAATALDWGLPVEKQRERHRPHNWGNTVHHNLLHDSGGWHTTPSGQLEFPAFTWAIYLDLDCCGWQIHDNVCYNTVLGGFMLNGGTDNVVENNVLADGKRYQIQWNPWSGYVMRDNRCRHNIFAYAGRPANLYALDGFRDEFVAFRNNLVHAGNGQIGIQGLRDFAAQGRLGSMAAARARRGKSAGRSALCGHGPPRLSAAVRFAGHWAWLQGDRSLDGRQLCQSRSPHLAAAQGQDGSRHGRLRAGV